MERIEVMELVEYELELRGVELSQLANQVSHGSSCRWVVAPVLIEAGDGLRVS